MKKLFAILLIFISLSSFANNRKGLLVIAHGSPSQQWNQPVLDLENSVKESLKAKHIDDFAEVKVALMEFTEPSISTVIKNMEKEGINKIYVLPLFIAPSGHSVYDVPTILGVYYNKKMAESLKKEGTEIVETKAGITIGPSLNYGDVIKNIILDNVNELSKDPKNEAIVILAHGDDNFMPFWEELCNETGNYILSKTGIEYYDKAFVEVGQSFAINGVSTILKAAQKKDRVIVVGMYLSSGVKNMLETSGIVIMGKMEDSKAMLEGKDIVYSDKGLLPCPKVTEWIVDRAVEWLNR
ncbi:MAG: sirohydrochlorin cobaltochelatase [Bacteroidales bacterium]|nr:sirohydrochlorin cobaltochelatase [Bacteroidales bacterium]